jgi:hypothetical protein
MPQLMIYGVVALVAASTMLSGCGQKQDPEQVEFEKRFARDAVLVKVCPPDPTLASGPGSAARQVYRFQNELWTYDHGDLRRVDAKPENVCEILQFPKSK